MWSYVCSSIALVLPWQLAVRFRYRLNLVHQRLVCYVPVEEIAEGENRVLSEVCVRKGRISSFARLKKVR